MKSLVLATTLTFTACSAPATQSQEHPDLKLSDDEFDAKYFPELVSRVQLHVKKQQRSHDLAYDNLEKSGDGFSVWIREEASEATMAQATRDILDESRRKMRQRLRGNRP